MKTILKLSIVLLLFSVMIVKAECDDVTLSDAQKAYTIGNFEEVLELLKPCVDDGFNTRQKLAALRLITLSYLAMDSTLQTRLSAEKLILHNPNYEPNIFDPPRYVRIIEDIKSGASSMMITSVSKKAENILMAPATVTVITEDDIKNRGYIDLEELFSDIPGFDVSRTFGPTYSNLYQRGYRSNNTDRTLFLIDGVEENDLWSNTVFWSRQFPISNVKRVEIVYGPASTMYGANALVGVVNIITKDPMEITNNRSIAVKFNGGYGTYNTAFADVTVAGKHKNMSFSVTARRLQSDEMDLSDYDEFDYEVSDYDTVDYKALLGVGESSVDDFIANNCMLDDTTIWINDSIYTVIVNEQGDTVGLNLTDYGEELARSDEKAAIENDVNGVPVEYTNISSHWYIFGKFRVADAVLGYEFWRYEQGGTNYFNDNNEAGSNNGSIWVPKQTFFYMKYDKVLSDNLSLMNFAQYRITEVDDESRAVYLANYSNGLLNSSHFYTRFTPFWITEYYYQISRQFRNEFKMTWTPLDNLDIVSGVEVRNSSIQGDYRKTTYYSFITDDPDTSESVIEIGQSSGDNILGGNDFTIYDAGVYAQGTYNYRNFARLTLGGRYDYNRIRVTGGYGSIFNPRIALVLTPGKFIFKGIYASAFQNASNWTKFSTNTSRLANNPTLPPEKVRNFEFSAGYNPSKKLNADLVYYYSKYDDVVGTGIVELPDGTTTAQNQAIGSLRIQGLQTSVSYKFNNFDLFANYTYSKPENEIVDDLGSPTGEYQRLGDISEHSANVGASAEFFEKLNVALRLNYIGEKPVGDETSVPANPGLSDSPGKFPSYMILNGNIRLFNILDNLELQLICNNILDTEYFCPGIRSADGSFYSYRTPQRRRNLILQLSYEY